MPRGTEISRVGFAGTHRFNFCVIAQIETRAQTRALSGIGPFRIPGNCAKNNLSCDQIALELEEARSEKGVTGTNVAAGLLFWPALLVTMNNAQEAIDAADEREEYLLELADTQNCEL